MKIGIVRHFKVDIKMPRLANSEEYANLVKKYSESPVLENEVDLKNINWSKCYSSTMKRAIITAEAIFKGEILKFDHIREVDAAPLFMTNLQLPVKFWDVASRIGWFANHKSQPENKNYTRKQVKEFVDILLQEKEENILVVCHGFLMISLEKELKSRGFKGIRKERPKNGALYVYEN